MAFPYLVHCSLDGPSAALGGARGGAAPGPVGFARNWCEWKISNSSDCFTQTVQGSIRHSVMPGEAKKRQQSS